MTTPYHAVATTQVWREANWQEALRRHKPFPPKLRAILEHLLKCMRAYTGAQAEFDFETAIGGAPDVSELRTSIRRLTRARREALVALSEDPGTSQVLPAAPTVPGEHY